MPQVRLPVRGLVTNPASDEAQGGFATASNVVIRRDGVVEPMHGFEPITGPGTSSARVYWLYSFAGRVLSFAYESAVASLRSWSGSGWTDMITGLGLNISSVRVCAAEARKNLYFTVNTSVLKAVSATDNAIGTAGQIPGQTPYGELTAPAANQGGFLPDGYCVAYRYVIKYTDANGYTVRSAPSGRIHVWNLSGAARNVTLTLPSYGASVGQFEIYRSENAQDPAYPTAPYLATPSDELRLVQTLEVSATTFVDYTTEIERGQNLYTNPSQEGIEKANYQPPACADMATWGGCTFYGRARRFHSMFIELNKPVADEFATATNNYAAGWGVHTGANLLGHYEVNTTIGNPVVVATSGVVGLVAGQMLVQSSVSPTQAGASIPANAIIQSIVGNNITLNVNALATTVGVDAYASDSITIAGQTYWPSIFDNASPTTNAWFRYSALDARGSIERLAYVANRRTGTSVYVNALSSSAGNVGISVTAKVIDTSFTVSAGTSGQHWSPNLVVAQTSTADSFDNGVYWSKVDEPEAVPLLQYIKIGSERAKVLRLIPLRDALLVFKEDGVWRISGFGPDSFRLDELDPSIRLAGINTPAVVDNVCYALTTRGVLAITETQAKSISGPIDNLLLQMAQEISQAPDGLQSAWGCANPVESRYMLGIPASSTSTAGTTDIFVFNTATGAWTTLDRDARACVWHYPDGKIYLADGGASNVVKKERIPVTGDANSEYLAYMNETGSLTCTGINGNLLTLDTVVGLSVGSAMWTLTGLGNGHVVKVTEIVDSTHVRVDDSSFLAVAVLSFGAPFTSTIEWNANHAGLPGDLKQFVEASYDFTDLRGLYALTPAWGTDFVALTNATEFTQTQPTALLPKPVRLHVPRNAQLGRTQSPKITITQAGARWKLQGVTLVFEPISHRLRRTA